MHIDFSAGRWSADMLTYAYSFRFEETPRFIQLPDCIQNRKDSSAPQEYDNVSIFAKESFGPGTTITTRCAFDSYGAPLITIAEALHTDSRGILRYGNYFEIVLYEHGINVWRMRMQDGTVTWKKLLHVEFPVCAMEIHTLSVRVEKDVLYIDADDRSMFLYVEDLYPRWYAGLNACEGVNRFYDLRIEKTL